MEGTVEATVEEDFDFHSKAFFLTYAQANGLDREAVRDALEEKFPNEIAEYHIAQEDHKDGEGIHFHVLGKFKKKKRLRGARCFDIWWDLHPHIESAKKWGACKAYVYKEDEGVLHNMKLDRSTDRSYSRRKQDYIELKRDQALARLAKDSTSMTCWGTEFKFPEKGVRKRHFYFWGPAAAGKTEEVQKNNFDKKNVSCFKPGAPAPNQGPYGTFDRYSGERFIIINDKDELVNKGVLAALSDISDNEIGEAPIRGRCKDPLFYKEVTIIIISNYAPGGYKNQDWMQEAWFTTRFTVVEIEHGSDGRGKIKSIL